MRRTNNFQTRNGASDDNELTMVVKFGKHAPNLRAQAIKENKTMSRKNESIFKSPAPPKGWHTKKTAALFMGIGEFRTGKIFKNRIASEDKKMQRIKRGKGFLKRWIVKESALREYQNTKGGASDGKSYSEVRLSDSELAKINAILKAQKLPTLEKHYARIKAKKNAKK